jgi:exopolysaccharide biosynthesis polyprenyl glycosylphosphotransferase
MKKSEIIFGLLKIPMDFFMVMFAFMIAFKLRTYPTLIPNLTLPVDMMNFPLLTEYISLIAKLSAVLIGIFAINNMYSLKITNKTSKEILKVLFLTSAWIMIIIAYFFLTRELFFSRLVLGYGWIATIILISSGRVGIKILQNLLTKIGIGQRRVLFLSLNEKTAGLLEEFEKNPHYNVIGCLRRKKDPETTTCCKILGATDDFKKIIDEYKIEEVVQTQYNLGGKEAPEILEFCRSRQIQYHFIPDLVQIHQKNIDVATIGGIPLITLRPTPLEGWGKVWKRLFDITGAGLGLIAVSPVFLIISIIIKLEDPKSTILFRYLDDGTQVKRVGQYAKLFNFYKFRTMKPGTHNLRYTELADKNTRDGPLVKIENDPRITRIGNFIRRTDLDELPQLWNVLKGEMSLVGPRPHLPEEVAKYDEHNRFVFTIKPGITGLAQISGRSDLSFKEEMKLDSYYIENWSLLLDIRIILKTFWAIVGDRKAS